MRSRRICTAVITGALAFGAAACGDDEKEGARAGSASVKTALADKSGTDYSKLTGSIRLDGSTNVQSLAEVAGELLGEAGSALQVTVGGVGTGDGFAKYCRGEFDIADASRRIKADEYAACEKKGITPVEVQVAIDGISVIVNPALEFPEDCITTKNLKKLLAPGSKIKNYAQLGEGYPDAPVSFFTPGTGEGTYDFFTEAVLETDAEQRTGSAVQTSGEDNQIVAAISGTEGALGYIGYAFADLNKDKLKTLAVDSGKGCVAPSKETIASNEYAPLARPLFMYPSTDSIKKPAVKGFLDFINENNDAITEASNYVALTDELKTAAKASIDGATPVEAPEE